MWEYCDNDKEKKDCKINDLVVSGDHNTNTKELEKIKQCKDLRLQLQKLWNFKATVIPSFVGALGTISDNIEKHLRTIGIPITINCMQKAALLGAAFSLKSVDCISENG